MSSPTTSDVPPACRRTSRRAASYVRDTSSSSSQPTIERRPDHSRAPAAVEPEAAPVGGGDGCEGGGGVLVGHDSQLATIAAPCCESTDSGWNCTPCRGSDTCRTPITTPSADQAVATSSSGSEVAASEW